ncbi:MAG: filamentous hemagglutinin N-terminal domain-containing protein, partial [Gammaproteobacteria bacterium]
MKPGRRASRQKKLSRGISRGSADTRLENNTPGLTPLAYCIRQALFPAGLLFTATTVLAGPEGGQVVGGNASIARPDSATTVINQQSHNVAIDWTRFNINHNELVQFHQPSSSAAALNHIHDQNPSQIHGSLRANGQVLLVNPNGVFFSPTARVNVGSLIASGLDLKTDDFMSGNYNFQALQGANGIIVNQGTLEAATGGSINLIGNAVRNEGLILANAGQVNLVAGNKVTMDFDGDGLLRFAVDESVLENAENLDAAVSNTGEILADGGRVLLEGHAAKDVFSNVVNNEGVIRAGRIVNEGGTIRLVAGGDANSVINTGTLDASGQGGDGGTIRLESTDKTIASGESVITASSQDGKGGRVEILGDKVGLLDISAIDVSGLLGGGTALIGGDFQGKNPDIRNASKTYVGEDA